ncbi:AAA family ATPase [Novosphingobium ginsenosidimutans]|uniref:DUF3696 domain-containing protein n=1 Tax=Novosphingobium ginsenosidimutans TaxID=1176536 RepID=A0A5B8RZ71_9SPHN|nr:DUF3696 domain-containing protein [Novosphingobium ginsenosidimutans]QEA14789.1 DUF3696 domain-containing protein [Novosphingobium ginsenosidimutans]
MLKKLTLRNFRAFRNQTFHFGKFNVFVGPNNSGKSSALSALNMIAQTVLNNDVSQSPLILNGPFDSLGTYLDLVHGGRSNTPMGFDLSFFEFEIRIEFKYRSQRREIEIVRYELYENERQVLFYSSRKDSFDFRLFGKDVDRLIQGTRKVRPAFRNLAPINSSYSLQMMRRFREEDVPESVLGLLRRADRAITQARIRLRRSFSSFDSLSPIREKPERTYLYSGERAERIGTTGANTALLLANDTSKRGGESKGIEEYISKWFQLTGIANGIRIDSISPRHFELVLVDFDNTKHNLSDVGFGCSQVLPVLASALNIYSIQVAPDRGNPILLVQEPEIHLHPNAQASLGSFFAGVVPDQGQLFIETHSDNLILRLARHVADGTIDENEMRIFYVHRQNSESLVHDIEIQEDGTFSQEWPGGFFPQRQSESLALAQQSSRAKDNSRREIQLIFEYAERARR